MVMDEMRFMAALLIGGVLTAIMTGSLYLISYTISPRYQYSITEGMTITLFIVLVFGILLGFNYWLIGYWQETKRIGCPDKNNGQNFKLDIRKKERATDISDMNVWQSTDGSRMPDNTQNSLPGSLFTTHSLQEFGIRQFNDNDDWINMRPGKKD
jgi:hypothetical protein